MLKLTVKIYFSLKAINSNHLVTSIYLLIYKTNNESEILEIGYCHMYVDK